MRIKWVYWLVRIRRLGEVERAAFVSGQCHRCDMWSEVENEGVEAGAEADGGQDAQSDPVEADE